MGARARPAARRLAAARGRAAAPLRALRRGRELHRALEARDDGARPRAAAVPARAREGEGLRPRDRPAGRAGLRAQAVPPAGPLHRHRGGHRLDQRVGQRLGCGRQGDRAAPQPGAGRAGPQRAALPVRGARHRHLPGPRVRGPDRVPRPGAQGHRAQAPLLARADRERPRRGPLRRARGRDRPDRARAGRPARARGEPPRRGPGLARRHRRLRGHRVREVGAGAAAAAAAGRVLRDPGGRRPHPAEVQLRRAGARPGGLAALHDGPDRQQRDPARRHDRRAEVHRAALRRGRLPGGPAQETAVPQPPGDAALARAGDRPAIRTVRRVDQLA